VALLPPFFLDCIVAIGEREDDGSSSWLASGFLYGQLEKSVSGPANNYSTFVVTNRHVLADKASIVLRFNPIENVPAREYDIDLTQTEDPWTDHPDPDVDVAVLPININPLIAEGIQLNYFRSNDHILDRKSALVAGLSEGDGVYVLGFPMGQVGGDRNFVLVRQGAIARIRDWLAGASKEIIVDVAVFPGNSGGPVVTKPEAVAITGTERILRANLIGVVASYVPYQDVAISTQTRRPRIIFEENSGLASVVPIDYVIETIDAHDEKFHKDEASFEGAAPGVSDAEPVPPEQGSIDIPTAKT
jgi:S1-C subfamily serine protease